jgi:thiamine-monophosphate kinase
MMDISDGLSSDLRRLCAASGVGALIDPRALPLPRGVGPESARRLALHGGDDYELLFAVAPRRVRLLPARFQKLRLTPIGEITKQLGIRVIGKNGTRESLRVAGWDPFRQRNK